jgi:ABC-2 type transport system ATP-binding protein
MGIVEVNNLNIEYAKGRKSVTECNFSVAEGEIFGLLGSNGAGKSTILKTFAGLNKDYSGEIKLFGEDSRYRSDEKFSEIAYIPQHSCMYRDFTVRENLEYFASMEGMWGDKKKERIELLLEMFFLKRYEKLPVGKLSGGYQQLLNIALSSILDKKIVLMDEPTAGLDLWIKRKVVEYIKDLKKRGKTVIFTTHNLEDAEDICDNVVILSDGSVLGKGNIRELLQQLGGGYTVHVYLSEPLKIKKLNLKHSSQFAVFKDHIVIESSPKNVGLAIKELVTRLERSKVKITEIEVHEPSLSYVFSSLIGGSVKK